MLGYLSADIICSEKRTVFRERSSKKTVGYEEQIMFKDKYPSIFSPQMETIFRNARSSENWGIFNNYSPKWRWLVVDIRELKQEDFSRRRRGEIREGPGLASSFSSQI